MSPAYDINPVETGSGLKLNISDSDNSLDLELALEVCEFFRLEKDRAKKIIAEVKSAVRNWSIIATKYGISKSDQDIKAIAFQRAES